MSDPTARQGTNVGTGSSHEGNGGIQAWLPALFGPTPYSPGDQKGKTVLVTGGARGIGFEISLAFARAGARVVMCNRKEEQGDEAIKNIKSQVPNASVDWFPVDLGSIKDTKRAFDQFAQKEERLDILVLNAGFMRDYAETVDGIEHVFHVNVLSQFLTFNRVLPLLRKTSKLPDSDVRVAILASEHMNFTRSDIHFGSLREINDNSDRNGPNNLYARSKLANVLTAKYAFYERVVKKSGDKIRVIAVHPGSVATDYHEAWNEYGKLGAIMEEFQTKFLDRSPEQGSYSTIYATTSDDITKNDWNGVYLNDAGAKPGKETAQADDEILGMGLWDLANRLIKEKGGEDALYAWDVPAKA